MTRRPQLSPLIDNPGLKLCIIVLGRDVGLADEAPTRLSQPFFIAGVPGTGGAHNPTLPGSTPGPATTPSPSLPKPECATLTLEGRQQRTDHSH